MVTTVQMHGLTETQSRQSLRRHSKGGSGNLTDINTISSQSALRVGVVYSMEWKLEFKFNSSFKLRKRNLLTSILTSFRR